MIENIGYKKDETVRKKRKILGCFCIIFYLFWAVVEMALVPYLDKTIGNECINTCIIDVFLKNLTWTLPAFMLCKRYRSWMHIQPKELFRLHKEKRIWLLAVPIIIAYGVLLSFIQNGGVAISKGFGLPSILVVLFVGITEEMVFRGLLLNATYCEENKVIMVLLNALMFLVIHFPRWMQAGIFVSVFTSFSFFTILFLSVVFAVLFIKSESLIVPILVHSIYDLVIMMLF